VANERSRRGKPSTTSGLYTLKIARLRDSVSRARQRDVLRAWLRVRIYTVPTFRNQGMSRRTEEGQKLDYQLSLNNYKFLSPIEPNSARSAFEIAARAGELGTLSEIPAFAVLRDLNLNSHTENNFYLHLVAMHNLLSPNSIFLKRKNLCKTLHIYVYLTISAVKK
jgi:hypothetical protein